jgi:hypothetical protein
MLSPNFLAPALLFTAPTFSPAIAAPVAPPTDRASREWDRCFEVQGRFDDDDDDWRRRRDRDGRWRRDD